MILVLIEKTSEGKEGFRVRGFANSHWPTKTDNVEWVDFVSLEAKSNQTTEWRHQNERAKKMIPNTHTSEPIFFKIFDPEGTNDIIRIQKLQIALHLDFTYSESYPEMLEDAHSSGHLLKIQNAQRKSKGTKKSSKSKANQSKGKDRKTQETQSKDTEIVESAKSLEIKKYTEEIIESLRQRVKGDAFSIWCETLLIQKTSESKLEDCLGFFSSSYSSGQSLDSILAQMEGLSCGQMADTALTIIESNPALHKMYVDWTENRELGQATCELRVLKEAILLFKGPLDEFRREQDEIEMQKTREEQRQLSELELLLQMRARVTKKRNAQEIRSRVSSLADSMRAKIPNEMTDVQRTAWAEHKYFADSPFFPKTDKAAEFKNSLSDFTSMPSDVSADDLKARLLSLHKTRSTNLVLRDAHEIWLQSFDTDLCIKDLRDFSESEFFVDLPKESATGLTSQLKKIKPNATYMETKRTVDGIMDFCMADLSIRRSFPAWQVADNWEIVVMNTRRTSNLDNSTVTLV